VKIKVKTNFEDIVLIRVPTGHIGIYDGEKGKLEYLSLSDYGKEKNVKADFLGITRELNGVEHGQMMPLEKKWVITISSQYGCSMGCKFCDVPLVGPGRNATFGDLIGQVRSAISIHPEVRRTKRLNIHYARMGEPTFNDDVINSAMYLAGIFSEKGWGFHPVVSTMFPKGSRAEPFVEKWLRLKNQVMDGNAGLQLSINTTDEASRIDIFNGNATTLQEIGLAMGRIVKQTGVVGRKIALNFALTELPIDAKYLSELFDPAHFMCKITPMHVTRSCEENGLLTMDGYTSYYPYQRAETDLKNAGFDVIVFIPSIEEDAGRITCGNAILSGRMPAEYEKIIDVSNNGCKTKCQSC